MSADQPADAQDGVLHVEGEMTIYRAAELRDVLLTALKGRRSLEIDLADVSDIDSAGVQLLMMAKQAAQAQGAELRLVRHSPAVIEVFELMDLAGHFGDPLLVPAA
jgi:anti-anti-sigma factor